MEPEEHEYYEYDDHENFTYASYPVVCNKDDVRSFIRVFIPVVYSLSLVIGLAGNSLVVAVYMYSKRLRTLTDTFVVHLAIADFLLLLTLPFLASASVQDWELGNVLCKLVNAIYTINFSCSMLLLACISLDRYFVLRPGLRDQRLGQVFRKKCSTKICALVWTVAFLLGIPDLVLSDVRELPFKKVCMVLYPSDTAIQIKVGMEVLEMLLSFLIPLLTVLYCYTQVVRTLLGLPLEARGRKWRVIRVLLAMVGAFVLTQLPYNTVKLCRVVDMMYSLVTHCDVSKALDQAAHITESLALTHCCLNPVLYAFMGSSFRQNVMKFAKRFGQRRRSAARREELEAEITFDSHSHHQETSSFTI